MSIDKDVEVDNIIAYVEEEGGDMPLIQAMVMGPTTYGCDFKKTVIQLSSSLSVGAKLDIFAYDNEFTQEEKRECLRMARETIKKRIDEKAKEKGPLTMGVFLEWAKRENACAAGITRAREYATPAEWWKASALTNKQIRLRVKAEHGSNATPAEYSAYYGRQTDVAWVLESLNLYWSYYDQAPDVTWAQVELAIKRQIAEGRLA